MDILNKKAEESDEDTEEGKTRLETNLIHLWMTLG